MLKMRWILPGLLVVLATNAIAAGSAGAATHAFFVEGTEVAKEKVEDLTITSFFKFESKIAGIKVLLECEGDISTGNLEEKGKTTGEIKLKECTLYEINSKGVQAPVSECTIKEPIEFKIKDELIAGPEDEFKPEEKETFTTIEVTVCALKGKFAIAGSEVCQLPSIVVEMPDHNLICDTNKLKLGTEPAELYSEGTIKLASGKEWYAS